MVWVRSPVYIYKRNETFYFSRSVPSDLRHRFNKKKIEVSLRTKSKVKAAKSALVTVESKILKKHIESCVKTSLKNKSAIDAKVDELLKLINK